MTLSLHSFHEDALVGSLVEVKGLRVRNARRSWLHHLRIKQPAITQQLTQRASVVHPQMMPEAYTCEAQFPQERFRRRSRQHGLRHECIGVSIRHIGARQHFKIGKIQSHDATGTQDALDLVDTRARLVGMQVLEHVGAIDHLDTGIGQWNTADHIGELNIVSPNELDEVAMIGGEKRAEKGTESGNASYSDAEGVVVVLPSVSWQASATDIDTHPMPSLFRF